MVARFRSSGEEGKPHSTKEGRSAEAQRAYIRQHGDPKPRRKHLKHSYYSGDKYLGDLTRQELAAYKKEQHPNKRQSTAKRVKKSHGGGVGIQTHGNKLAKALNTQTPDHSVYLNEDNYLKGGIKIRS